MSTSYCKLGNVLRPVFWCDAKRN